ncbi:MAG: winged helix-turn-helix transcriptional regulator, partial [Planctomycetes bacterium]|nr:winged helix-turn-helix transcriptional regulator [Planctomycetota bacterium]
TPVSSRNQPRGKPRVTPREDNTGAASQASLRDFMAITKALADEQRVRVLLALERGELCVCQIVELMGLATSTISKHMSILKHARLVDSRKEGRWIYYRRADKNAPPAVRRAIAWVTQCVGADPQAVRDKQRLAEIRTQDPHDLCVSQGACHRKCP